MKYIALTGQIASGKTTLAQELVSRGYLLVNFTDLLKVYAARMLTAIGHEVTVADILAEKEAYRALLQDLGTLIGFDAGGKFVVEALDEWVRRNYPRAVFDNVRTNAQAQTVRELGFEVVELRASNYTRMARLQAAGKDPAYVTTLQGRAIESGLCAEQIDFTFTTDASTPAQIADFLERVDAGADYEGFDGHYADAQAILDLTDEPKRPAPRRSDKRVCRGCGETLSGRGGTPVYCVSCWAKALVRVEQGESYSAVARDLGVDPKAVWNNYHIYGRQA